ncbi:MAG: DUF2169 domain-containing protein [Polyangiaceae bacterium]
MAPVISNSTNLKLGFFWCQLDPPTHGVTFVVKGTYDLVHGAAARAVDAENALSLAGDESYEDGGKACRYPSDFAPKKARADVMVVGAATSPEPVKRMEIALKLGALDKRLLVVGDRVAEHHSGKWIASEPKPFTRMPLRYERALGGPSFLKNPIGCGVRPTEGESTCPMPNLELPGRVSSTEPAGLGPLDRRWADRMSKVGTYDATWRKERWPWFPKDFDFAYFNAAPLDQQIELVRGDEAIRLEGLRGAAFESRLPGVRPRLFVRRPTGDAEVALAIDTVWIDADAARLVLVWRGHINVESKRFEEISSVVLASEELASPLRPASEHLAAAVRREPTEEELADREEAEARADSESDEAPANPENDEEAAVREAKELLVKGGAPAELLAKLENVRTTDAMLEVLQREGPSAEGASEADIAAAHAHARQVMLANGVDPSALEDLTEEAPATEPEPSATLRLDREDVLARRAAGEDLDGFDLSGADLSGLDLARVSMRKTRLVGARLDGALLAGAILTGADLEGAHATAGPVIFAGADLTEAKLARVVFPGAVFESADLTRASMKGARLARASLSLAVMEDADLSEADLSHADLSGANLARPRSTRAAARVEPHRGRPHGREARSASPRARSSRRPRSSARRAPRRAARQGAGRGREVRERRSPRVRRSTTSSSTGPTSRARSSGRARRPRPLREAVLEKAAGAELDLAGADLSGCALPARCSRALALNASRARERLVGRRSRGRSLRRRGARARRLHRERARARLLRPRTTKHAVLVRARLAGARLTKVNLLRLYLEARGPANADCRSSNFFESEFLDAVLHGRALRSLELLGRIQARQAERLVKTP